MTALTLSAHNRYYKEMEEIQAYPIAAATKILKGGFNCLNAGGYLIQATDTAGLKFVGVAVEEIDNTAGGNGDLLARVAKRFLAKFAKSGTITEANVGDTLCVKDDNTAQLGPDSTNEVEVGTLQEIDGTSLWIRSGAKTV